MLGNRASVLAVASLVPALTGTALAQSTSTHLTAVASVGYTDNALGAPQQRQPGDPEKLSSVFFLLVPGALLYHDTPRAAYLAAYRRTFAFYLATPENNAAADNVDFAGAFELTPVDDLTVGLGLAHSSFALLAINGTNRPVDEVQPGGQVELLGVTINQTWSHEFSEDWRGTQDSLAGFTVPLGTEEPEPWTYAAGVGYGLRLLHKRDSHTWRLGATTLWDARYKQPFDPEPETRVVVGDLTYAWTRDLSARWSSRVGTGLSGQLSADDSVDVLPPLATAALNYDHDHYSLNLSVTRAPAVNLNAGRIFFNDRAMLLGTLTIVEDLELVGTSFASVGRNRALTPDGSGIEGINVFTAGAALGWPIGPFAFNLQYTHFRQFGETSDSLVYRDMVRNVALLTVGTMWPERQLNPVYVPTSERVDGADVPSAEP